MAADGGVQVLEGCVLVAAPWADGDSFPVRLPDGREVTVRLYEVDCPEARAGDTTDARRIRDQRRYFGLESGETVMEFGRAATERAHALLANPFTVRTLFVDGRGDARYKRYYAWVELADGRDLGEVLVSEGMARAFGVYRERFDGNHQDERRERMADLEMAAAVKGRGIWGRTDWDRLPNDRQELRLEQMEVNGLTDNALAPGETIDLNKASRDELMRLPGIGDTLATRIIEARRFNSVEDLLRVDGIGEQKLEAVREWITVDPE